MGNCAHSGDHKPVLGCLAHAFDWQSRAENLWAAAEVLLEKRRIAESTFVREMRRAGRRHKGGLDVKTVEAGPYAFSNVPEMLIGLAVEVLLKAVWFLQNDSNGDPPRQWRGTKGHNLCSLSQSVGISWTEEGEQFLRDLEAAVTWIGRYPVPFEFRDPSKYSFDEHVCAAMFRRIRGEYDRCLGTLREKDAKRAAEGTG